jgi:hypothetical protein
MAMSNENGAQARQKLTVGLSQTCLASVHSASRIETCRFASSC